MQTAPPAPDSAAVDSLVLQPLDVSDAASGLWIKLGEWYEGLVVLLPNLFVAVLIVVAAAFLARLARRVVSALLLRVTDHAPQARNVVELLSTLAYVAVLAVGLFLALRVIGLSGVVTTLLAGAGIVGLALGFAFQDIAANFIAGVLMAVRNPFVVGQIIESNGFMGTVKEISLRSTVIDTFAGQKVIVPNAKVFGDPIVNYSARLDRRVDVACGVGYGDDLEHAERVAVRAIEGLDGIARDKPVQLYYSEFGDSSINFTLRFWVSFGKQTDFLDAQSRAIKAIKAAFDANGVTIPFPIRTLDFDPNGGVDLRSALKGSGGGAADGPQDDDDGRYDDAYGDPYDDGGR
ncbi:mechanosensitive ion channel family protein [Rubrivirga sp. S365]|uniref:Mechanosensitive ion channel family protein n=1 Tax=Rubrivirga litoralis TaxID=3075598 RepID=A0ABU3BNS7_9BACT|nr:MULTISPECIES: mechanosensitive ion channel family protein [unclassified Rubrivirga]MDT0630942.1 mechanosensitive ion channel family protein [Rubrivirga sp. F394]MDT7856585.1 mechanosensitive ion channel family protein [Rubrivirga sp. S365]